MNRKLLVAAALIAILTVDLAAQKMPSFSGTWVLDASRSESQEDLMPKRKAKDLVIVHRGSEFRSSLQDWATGLIPDGESFTLDGKEVYVDGINKFPGGKSGLWNEGKVILFRKAYIGFTCMIFHQWYELSPDGNTLTLTLRNQQELREAMFTEKLVYKRK